VFYVFSVITTKIFGQNFPDWFGTLGDSMFTLFQIMTLESWSMGHCPTGNGNLSVGVDFICRFYNFVEFYRIKFVYRYHNRFYADVK
jgi:hypothetical protein